MKCSIEVCHVIPEDSGGSAAAAENIASGDRKIYCNVSGYLGLFRSFFCIFRLWLVKADIINFHNPMPAFFYLLFPHSKKVVFTSHGSWIGFFLANPARGPFGKAKAPVLVSMQKFVINNSDAVVAVSNRVKDIIVQTSHPKKIAVIHNGVDTEKFKPARRAGKTALWVGNNPWIKGLKEAVETAKEKRMKLLVVGIDGNDTDNVKYLGCISPEKMPGIYKKCSLLIYPSKWEGHPLVPLEAMASGLAIIASKESNVEILPLKRGFYVASGRLARKIAEKYTWKRARQKYGKLWKKVQDYDA